MAIAKHDEVDFGLGTADMGDMFSDVDMLEGQGSAETFDAQYKTIQWANGDRAAGKKYQDMNAYGGFFFPERMAFDEDVMLAHGWTKEEMTHKGSDETTPGYWKRELSLIPIIVRETWQVKRDGKSIGAVGFDNSQRYGDFNAFRKAKWDGYKKAEAYGVPSIRLQVLCLLVGLEDQGAVCITLGGNVARAFYDERGESALGNFYKTVGTVANQKSDDAVRAKAAQAGSEAEKNSILRNLNKKWGMRAFKVTIGADRDEKGAPVYTTVGKGNNTSDITAPIALDLPAKGETVDLSKWSAGRALYATANEIFEEAKGTWAVAWDNMLPTEDAVGAVVDSTHATLSADAAKNLGM